MDRYETVANDLFSIEGCGFEWLGAAAKKLRERFPEPGRCGECRWWDSPQNPRDDETPLKCWRCTNPQRDTHDIWTLQDFSCPRFKPKPDAYEKLAREYCESRSWSDEVKGDLADFLRERVTVREGE